jgi:pyrimidine and pyridine-specific 5'-nucleotidase
MHSSKLTVLPHSGKNVTSAAVVNLLQVGRSAIVPGADHALESIHNIKEAFLEIWEGHDWPESDADAVPASVGAVETAVVA